MALFLLENRDFLGFRMIFKVQLNQIFSNFNTMRCTIKSRLSSIMVKLTFAVHESQHVSFLSLPHSKFGMRGYGTSHCVKVWKDLVESYLKYHSET